MQSWNGWSWKTKVENRKSDCVTGQMWSWAFETRVQLYRKLEREENLIGETSCCDDVSRKLSRPMTLKRNVLLFEGFWRAIRWQTWIEKTFKGSVFMCHGWSAAVEEINFSSNGDARELERIYVAPRVHKNVLMYSWLHPIDRFQVSHFRPVVMEIEIGGRSEKSLCGQESTAVDQELASKPAPPGSNRTGSPLPVWVVRPVCVSSPVRRKVLVYWSLPMISLFEDGPVVYPANAFDSRLRGD